MIHSTFHYELQNYRVVHVYKNSNSARADICVSCVSRPSPALDKLKYYAVFLKYGMAGVSKFYQGIHNQIWKIETQQTSPGVTILAIAVVLGLVSVLVRILKKGQ
jgi:hypothetical protein